MSQLLRKHVLSSGYLFSKTLSVVKASPSLLTRSLSTTTSNYCIFNVQDEDDFREKVLNSTTPVIVDFHAKWCGPCKLLGPRLEKIIGSKGDKVHLAKVDIDAVSEVAMEYDVSAVPSVIGFKNGKPSDKFIGLQDENKIELFVQRVTGE